MLAIVGVTLLEASTPWNVVVILADDLGASGLACAGSPFHETPALDSLATAGREERALWWHFPHYHASSWRPGSALRRGPWKLVQHYESGRVELSSTSLPLRQSTKSIPTCRDGDFYIKV